MKKIVQGSIINHVGEWQINFATPATINEEEKELHQLSFEDIFEVEEVSKQKEKTLK